ncbi:hypothetical protein BB560_005907 [Smittium megazygosporum]|uniref:Pyroglutamyl-peptidase I n=1 Tax=Smittium megazygosporum TaxID=133381 RepID=A0A2T9YR76_9FUNG|nr:hypothetical protein BB560_005907 [Smittium megazygosporum]
MCATCKYKKRVLITGFEPFGQPRRPRNRSWDTVKLLSEKISKLKNTSLENHQHSCKHSCKQNENDKRKTSLENHETAGNTGDNNAKQTNIISVTTHETCSGLVHAKAEPCQLDLDAVLLPVNYMPAKKILQDLHSLKSFDLVVHVGEGKPDFIYIETIAHRTGFTRFGNNGPTDIPPNNEIGDYSMLNETLQTRADVLSIARELDSLYGNCEISTTQTSSPPSPSISSSTRTNSTCSSIKVSTNAGRYLCEFVYYISLAEAELSGRSVSQPTLFVHLPPESQSFSDDEIVDVLLHIVTNY